MLAKKWPISVQLYEGENGGFPSWRRRQAAYGSSISH